MLKKIAFIFILCFPAIFLGEEYLQNRVLFCVHKNTPKLVIDVHRGQVTTNFKTINNIIAKYGIIRISRWLPSADARDVVGDIALQNIYKAEFAKHKMWEDLQNILLEFRSIEIIHSARLEGLPSVSVPIDPYVPFDPDYEKQWYIDKIMANYAWGLWGNNMPGDSTILVGVVDTGVDHAHPDLQRALYINPGEDIDGDGFYSESDNNGIDDDENGYIDDIRGWDFVGSAEDSPQDNDIRPPYAGNYEILSHGTHVGGIMAATANNNIGITGLAIQSKLIATKHSYDTDLGNGYLYNAYEGILYCAKMGAKIINCSWGGGGDYGEYVIDDVVENYGAIVVCAAGNDNTNNDIDHHYPSDYVNSIAVAALTRGDRKASFSNYGQVIDIGAPGVGIYSTIHYSSGGYTSWQGTSMASPVVAGAFAILWSWFPENDRDWIIERLYSAADNIDELNPGVAGLLGHGRVNVYNAIAPTIYPSLQIEEFELQVEDTNDDGQLNPGEKAKILLTIKNEENWMPAENTRLVIKSESPLINFIDSTANLGLINSSDSINNDADEIIFQVTDDANYQPFEISVKMIANENSDYSYLESESKSIHISANQKGFPLKTGSVNVPVAIANLNNDEQKEVIFVDMNNLLYACDADGKVLSGFPVDLGSYTKIPPVIADMNNDQQNEIIIITRSGFVHVIKNDGSSLFNFDIKEPVYGNAAVANMDDDPELEIVFGTMARKLHVVKMDSTELTGFPIPVSSLINHGVALADVDDDFKPEMIYGTFDGQLHILNTLGQELNGWPKTLESKIEATPVILRQGASVNIIVSNTQKQLQSFNQMGDQQFNYELPDAVALAPALCDINQDGAVEIILNTINGQLFVFDLTGQVFEQFPVQLNASTRISPVLMNSNTNNYLLSGNVSGSLFLYNDQALPFLNFPAMLETAITGSPAVDDLDNDGDLEIVFGGSDGLYALDISAQKNSTSDWSTYLGNNQRTGLYETNPTFVENMAEAILPSNIQLWQNSPNPFNPKTTIKFFIPTHFTIANIKLEVYNVVGQKIKTLLDTKPNPGMNKVTWDGLDEYGKTVASGIYIYKLYNKRINLRQRMIYLK